nr:unnamed protein product [Callosobruchus chinensis]CAH7750786.1 unnamed protein product [Callosobruchus chinensis]
MSSFFSNIFSGGKSKKNKTSKGESKPSTGTFTSNDTEDREDEDLPVPVLNRRYSLSKSGRMKEKKRMKIAIKDNFPASEDKRQTAGDDNDCDFSDKAVFDADGIIDEMNKCCGLNSRDKDSGNK